MKRKSIICWILSFCMVSSMSALTFAEETNSKELEKIIVAVKKIITIPNSYTEFTYSSMLSEYPEYETTDSNNNIWNLEWSEPVNENINGRISVSIDENNNLLSYNKYINDKNQVGLAQFTKEQSQNPAEEFMAKVLPKYASQMVKIDSDVYDFSNTYNFEYQLFTNDIPVSFTKVNINVNKYNNEVESFKATGLQNELEYPSKNDIIKYSDAKKAYIEKIGIDLKYYSNYDYKSKQLNIFPAYSLNDKIFKAIDSKTGELVDIYRKEYISYKEDHASAQVESVSGDSYNYKSELTKEEIDAINNISNIISKEKAENIIRENIDTANSDMKVTNVALSKDYIDENEYIWRITFDKAYGQVNANSGELISFSYYNNENNKNEDTKISEDEAKIVAENFLNKVAYNKFSQTKYDKPYALNINIINPNNEYYFTFVRQVNGIDFVNNSLNVTVDSNTGKIISYNSNWYKKSTFPDISNIMTQEKIFDIINKSEKFGLTYKMTDKNKVALVYDFTNTYSYYRFDPVEGIRIDSKGEKYVSNTIPKYTDIEGHWCEKTVNKLLENGYYIQSEIFGPDHNITQINFLKYLYSPSQRYYKDDEFYNMLIENGIIKKEEQSPDSYVSRQDAVKFVVKYLGYDKIANYPEIFVNPFKDTIPRKYLGYASICYGLGIIKADEQGNFNGTNNITNAETAMIIYNLLNVK